MPEQVSPPEQQGMLSVVAWNILLDKARTKKGIIAPQDSRLDSQVETLRSLPLGDIDVALLQEVEKTKKQHNGEVIARTLGYRAGYWFEHNTSKRKGEYIGMFGDSVEDTEAFDLGHDKVGVITMIGGVAVVGFHFRKEHIGPQRADQARAVLERVEGMERVVLLGDANALSIEKARRQLHGADFESAFTQLGRRNPKTHPTPEYRKIFYAPVHRPFLPNGTSTDLIYVRGMQVHDADRFLGDSDHYGLWATMSKRAA